MKKIQTLIIALTLGVITTSCYRHGKHVTIVTTSTGQAKMKIEYSGRVIFNDDQTGIVDLSRDGYFKYEKNGETINVERDRKGRLMYELNDAPQTTVLTEQGKSLLSEAIKEIAKQQHKRG